MTVGNSDLHVMMIMTKGIYVDVGQIIAKTKSPELIKSVLDETTKAINKMMGK